MAGNNIFQFTVIQVDIKVVTTILSILVNDKYLFLFCFFKVFQVILEALVAGMSNACTAKNPQVYISIFFLPIGS